MHGWRHMSLLLWSFQDHLPILLMHWCTGCQNQNKMSLCLGEMKKASLLPHDSPSWLWGWRSLFLRLGGEWRRQEENSGRLCRNSFFQMVYKKVSMCVRWRLGLAGMHAFAEKGQLERWGPKIDCRSPIKVGWQDFLGCICLSFLSFRDGILGWVGQISVRVRFWT